MARRISLLVTLLLVLSGCALLSPGRPLHQRLNPSLEAGDTWTVNVRYWPERFKDPYVENDTSIRAISHYRVMQTGDENPRSRLLIDNPSDTFLLTVNSTGNIRSVDRILNRTPSGVVKTQGVLMNKLGDRMLFDPEFIPSVPVFLFHPDLSSSLSRNRVRFDRGLDRTGDWVVQEAEKRDSRVRIVIRHKPSRSKIVFTWKPGDPWWSTARWYRSERLIARAERLE